LAVSTNKFGELRTKELDFFQLTKLHHDDRRFCDIFYTNSIVLKVCFCSAFVVLDMWFFMVSLNLNFFGQFTYLLLEGYNNSGDVEVRSLLVSLLRPPQFRRVKPSVADPDPYVLGPPRSASRSVIHKYGSGSTFRSFHHQAK